MSYGLQYTTPCFVFTLSSVFPSMICLSSFLFYISAELFPKTSAFSNPKTSFPGIPLLFFWIVR